MFGGGLVYESSLETAKTRNIRAGTPGLPKFLDFQEIDITYLLLISNFKNYFPDSPTLHFLPRYRRLLRSWKMLISSEMNSFWWYCAVTRAKPRKTSSMISHTLTLINHVLSRSSLHRSKQTVEPKGEVYSSRWQQIDPNNMYMYMFIGAHTHHNTRIHTWCTLFI